MVEGSINWQRLQDARAREAINSSRRVRFEAIATFVRSTLSSANLLSRVLELEQYGNGETPATREAKEYLAAEIEREFRRLFGRPMVDDEANEGGGR